MTRPLALRGSRTIVALLGLVLGLGVVAAAPADAEPELTQTISFTSTAPTDLDWFFGGFIGGYFAQATATSGLPIAYSVDPASTGVCRVDAVYQDHPFFGTGAKIALEGPGTCVVLADQAGNDEYLAAEQVSQSFVVAKAKVRLTADRATKGLLGLTPSTFTATLGEPYLFGPGVAYDAFPGQVVTFQVAGKQVCSATTGSDGVARCKATIGLLNALNQKTYSASFAGTERYASATVTAPLK